MTNDNRPSEEQLKEMVKEKLRSGQAAHLMPPPELAPLFQVLTEVYVMLTDTEFEEEFKAICGRNGLVMVFSDMNDLERNDS